MRKFLATVVGLLVLAAIGVGAAWTLNPAPGQPEALIPGLKARLLATWETFSGGDLLEGIASGNGRIEATEVDIATKYAGRLIDVQVDEGDMVTADQLLAHMDTEELEAQLRETEAELTRARAERQFASAVVAQRESELEFAAKELGRSQTLVAKGHVSKEQVDRDLTGERTAKAALQAARVQVLAAEAAIEAANARTERIKTQIAESTLATPLNGRVIYRLAEPGEVLGAGGKVLTVLDLTDVYMTIFLPTAHAGKVDVGADARIVLDAAPDLIIPAKVSFIAARAQFTPREVETQTEREKLMFRVKVKIDPTLLERHIEKVKTGLPGVAYVRLGDDVSWPERLQPSKDLL